MWVPIRVHVASQQRMTNPVFMELSAIPMTMKPDRKDATMFMKSTNTPNPPLPITCSLKSSSIPTVFSSGPPATGRGASVPFLLLQNDWNATVALMSKKNGTTQKKTIRPSPVGASAAVIFCHAATPEQRSKREGRICIAGVREELCPVL